MRVKVLLRWEMEAIVEVDCDDDDDVSNEDIEDDVACRYTHSQLLDLPGATVCHDSVTGKLKGRPPTKEQREQLKELSAFEQRIKGMFGAKPKV